MEWIPKTEYGKKLQDPRWQKRRLEILERDRYQCQACGDCRNMLHVHHVMYCPWERIDPWDEPTGLLVTLCAKCHEVEPQFFRDALYQFLTVLGTSGIRVSHELQFIVENTEASYQLREDRGNGESPMVWSAIKLAENISSFEERRAEYTSLDGMWFYEI